MILVNGDLAWPNTLETIPSYPQLDKDIHCDCLVIGGGMSGALTSYMLSTNGIDTALIEKRAIGRGSTSANTGLLQYANDKSLTSCIQSFGEKNGVLFYQLCREAMRLLRKAAYKLDIDPHFNPRSTLYFASSHKDIGFIQEEYNHLRAYGFDAELWNEDDIKARFPFIKPAGIYTHGDAEVNPFRFIHGIIQKAQGQGAKIFENTKANRFQFKDDGVIIHTDHYKIHAKKVIFAAGYDAQKLKKDRIVFLNNTYVLVTEPVHDLSVWHERSMIWETARPYLYIRTTPDQRIVIGGLDEDATDSLHREARIYHRTEKLLEEIKALFPSFSQVKAAYRWGALFASTEDGLPLIGEHPDYPHCYFIEGYGGNGTVYSMIGADLITDTIKGIHRPELELFSYNRIPALANQLH